MSGIFQTSCRPPLPPIFVWNAICFVTSHVHPEMRTTYQRFEKGVIILLTLTFASLEHCVVNNFNAFLDELCNI